LNVGANIPEINIENIHSQEEANLLLMKSIKINNSLDSFVKKTYTKAPEEMIIPKQKDINLKDPSLKTKGVSNSLKKKNINNKYEEENKKK
jgi:hypothetical protein